MTETTIESSDIFGEGWGSSHVWERDITDRFGGNKGTRYFCRTCGVPFIHLYGVEPSIFKAMQDFGVPETCPSVSA